MSSTPSLQPPLTLLNFSHPLTRLQLTDIEALASRSIDRIINIGMQFDDQMPFAPQVSATLKTIDLTVAQWQSESILIVPPSLNTIAVLLLAELHGRMGYFPTLVRMRPIAGSVPRRYEAAELLDLQYVRQAARRNS